MNFIKPVAIAAIALMLGTTAALAHADGPAKQKRGFDTIDTNKDGAITAEEFKTMLSQKRAKQASRADAKFKRIDANTDGKVTQAEFDTWRAARQGHKGHKGHQPAK